MSNGENVLADSWEEIDDENLTNQLDKIKKEAEEIEKQKNFDDRMPLQNGDLPAIMLAIRPDDGNYSAGKPAVKILRRPTQSNDSKLNDKPRQPIKTLQQREQEYAEARLRILGSAKNPEDELDAALDKLLSTKITPDASSSSSSPTTSPISNNTSANYNTTNINGTLTQQQMLLSSLTYHSPERLQRQQQRQQAATASVVDMMSARDPFNSGSFINYNQRVPEFGARNDDMQFNFNNRVPLNPQGNVLRTPRGPETGGGFNMRR